MDNLFPNRLREAIEAAGISQKALMEKIDVSESSIYRWFNGAKPQKRILEKMAETLGVNEEWLSTGKGEMIVREWISTDPARARSPSPDQMMPKEGIIVPTMIPVFGEAEAGLACDYEQIPYSWEDKIPALVKDKKAFGVRIHGDSMEPKFSAGDIAIVTPSFPARNGDHVVACLRDEGFLFKVMSLVGGDPRFIRLSSYNKEMFPPMEFNREQFVWMHPVVQVLKTIRR